MGIFDHLRAAAAAILAPFAGNPTNMIEAASLARGTDFLEHDAKGSFPTRWIRGYLGNKLARCPSPTKAGADRRRQRHRDLLRQWQERTFRQRDWVKHRLIYEFGVDPAKAEVFASGKDYPRPRRLREALMFGRQKLWW